MTVVNIRDELKELREIAEVSTPQLCMAIREVARRIEDAIYPAGAPPFYQQQCTCVESYAKYGDDLCRCRRG